MVPGTFHTGGAGTGASWDWDAVRDTRSQRSKNIF